MLHYFEKMSPVPIQEWLPSRDFWVGLVLASLMVNILALVFPLALLQVYDRLIPNEATNTLFLLFTGVITAMFVELLLRILRSYVGAWADARLGFMGAGRAFNHLMHSQVNDFEREGSGVQVDRLNGLDTLRDFFGGQAIISLIDIPFVLVYLVLIYYIAPGLIFVPILMQGLLLLSAYISVQRLFKVLDKQSIDNERRLNFLVEVLSGIHTVKSLGMEEQVMRRYERLQQSNIEEDFEITQKSSMSTRMASLIAQLNTIMVVTYGASLVMVDELTIGALAATTLLAGRTMQPVGKAIGLWNRMQTIRVAKQRNDEIFSIRREINAPDLVIDNLRGNLELKDVYFKYPSQDDWLLKGINLKVSEGEFIIITGDGQSGKSTFLSILAGLIEPTEGVVLAEGKNLYEHNLREYRKAVGHLPQEGKLFEGTIMENITLFRYGDYKDKAKILSIKLGLHDTVEEMQEGYQTMVGQGAVDFVSRGIKQRIIIARSLMNDPPVILFDEANTALDVNADTRLKRFVESLKHKKTIIMVTHRPSLIELGDAHYHLSNGELKKMEHKPKPPTPETTPSTPSVPTPKEGG